MRRVMSIWFPQLPLDRWVRRADPRLDGPFAIVKEIKNALRVTHLTGQALKEGVTTGQSLPDARAICPELLTEIADPEREGLILRALWRWADRLSPWVALDAPDGLFLDISGCSHLFGGEREMADTARTRLEDMQIACRIGISDTKLASWALARFSDMYVTITPRGGGAAALKVLPLAALNLKPQTETDLRRTGLKTVGDLYGRKSSELARRFGLELTQNLSHALGHAPDPISPQSADPVYAARMTLPDPIGFMNDLHEVLRRLTASVCGRLETDQMGARHYDLTVRCVDTGPHVLSIGFARPCYDPGAVMQQFSRPLEGLKIEYGADWFRLVANNLEPLRPRQRILGQEAERAAEDYDKLISTLGNRLGFDRVRKFQACDAHAPELEFTSVEAADRAASDWPKEARERPFRLFQRPERLRTLQAGRPPQKFQWRRQSFETVEVKGPERIVPPWWRDGGRRARDYWITTVNTGQRFWLMTYPGGNPPEWFIAGRFA